MKKSIWIKLLLLAVAFPSSGSFSQVAQQWVQRYSSPGNTRDIPSAMTVDRFGNVYVTGTINQIGFDGLPASFAEDYATIKYNAAGVQQWIATYNGPGNGRDDAEAIAVDFSGNVYVTGWSTVGPNSEVDVATIKYNSAGVQQWVALFDGSLHLPAEGSAITVDGSGNVYVTGNKVVDALIYDLLTIKYNASGVQQWVQTYHGASNINWGKAIAVDLGGNAYVSGFSYGVTPSDTRGATIKYTPTGTLLWVQRSQAQINDMTIDVFGNVYVTGVKGDFQTGDYSTIKYKTNGNLQWEASFNGLGNAYDESRAIAIDIFGNVYVTGASDGGISGYDYATVKYNAAGVQQWVTTYNGPANENDLAEDLSVDLFGNVYVTGRSGSGRAAVSFDYLTVKYNSSGLQQWEARYNGPASGDDEAIGLRLNGPGGQLFGILAIGTDIYVTGLSDGLGTGKDFATIKYSQPLVFSFQVLTQADAPSGASVLSEQSEFSPGSYRLSNFPNPFSVSTKILYDLPADSRISIKVFDLLGREVATLVEGERKTGSYNTEFYAGGLTNGVYYCRFVAQSLNGHFQQTRKILVFHK